MTLLDKHSGLFTDHYELAMAQGYFLSGRNNMPACFDYFFRKNPFKGGYTVFAGLTELLDTLVNFRYNKEDCKYLRSIGFSEKFTDFLSNFSFKGNIHAVNEGEIVFPNEPVLRVEGNILETQLVETILLNILNFESLIATKAARIRQVAGNKQLIDFGLRRAQGLGGIQASYAAFIGGTNKTSNVYSALKFGLESTGTMAHSWIQTFDDELTAFRVFAENYPDNCVLLVDTYDTLKSGVPNAIIVAKELEHDGKKLRGVRLDSGDLAYLSKKTRKMLDDAGLQYIPIIASNQLDEFIIQSLAEQEAPIDIYGIGTSLITGKDEAALDGIYKLSMINGKPTFKISENTSKTTLPGIKDLQRYIDSENQFYADGITLSSENDVDIIFHPFDPDKKANISIMEKELLLKEVMEEGKITIDTKTPEDIRKYLQIRFKQLPESYKRFLNPDIYKVGISRKLRDLKDTMAKKMNYHESIINS